jgi:hypothetical protein
MTDVKRPNPSFLGGLGLFCPRTLEARYLRNTEVEQSKLGSLIEAGMNILIGYVVALVSQIVVFPWFDINVPLSTNLLIGFWFTIISLVRSYIIRRWFNARLHRAAHSLSKTQAR